MNENERAQKKYLDAFVPGWTLFTNGIGAVIFSIFFSSFLIGADGFLFVFVLSAFIGLFLCIPAILFVNSVVYLLEKTSLNPLVKTCLLVFFAILFLVLIMFFTFGEGSTSIFFDYEILGICFLILSCYAAPMIYWIYKKDPYEVRKEEFDSVDEFDDILDRF